MLTCKSRCCCPAAHSRVPRTSPHLSLRPVTAPTATATAAATAAAAWGVRQAPYPLCWQCCSCVWTCQALQLARGWARLTALAEAPMCRFCFFSDRAADADPRYQQQRQTHRRQRWQRWLQRRDAGGHGGVRNRRLWRTGCLRRGGPHLGLSSGTKLQHQHCQGKPVR